MATPPDLLGAEIARALAAYPDAVVTDVGSVKGRPLADLIAAGVDLEPLRRRAPDGRQRALRAAGVGAGPVRGPNLGCRGARRGDVRSAVELVEGWRTPVAPSVVRLTTGEHDLAVARISHLPHLLAALTAGQLARRRREHLALSGQGVRDVTRIAAGDPALWQQIVTRQRRRRWPACCCRCVTGSTSWWHSLGDGDAATGRGGAGGGRGGDRRRSPASTVGRALALAEVTVAIPDEPGALARLFADTGDAGVNIEDVRIDHDPARAYGLVELDVAAEPADRLVEALADEAGRRTGSLLTLAERDATEQRRRRA